MTMHSLQCFTLLLGTLALAASSSNAALPSVYRATSTVYSTNGSMLPAQMAFASDGTMYVGNGDPNAVNLQVWRIPPGGGPSIAFGNTGTVDPDAVAVDRTGS